MGWADDEGGDAKGAKDEPRRRPRRASDEPAEAKDQGPRRPQKSENAWGSSSTGKSSTRRDDDSDGEPRRRKRLADDDDGGETEITMIIPDLDEQAEEDITLQVAEAPRNRTIKLPTLAELNADLAAHSIIPVKPGEKRLDLSLLNNRLVPPAMVKENTEDWTWDGLLRDVARDFQEEAERNLIMKEKKAAFEKKFATKSEDTGEALLKRQAKGGRRAAPKPKKEEGKEDKEDAPRTTDTSELDKALGKKEKSAAKGGRRARKREPEPEAKPAPKEDSDSDDGDIAMQSEAK